MHTRDLKKLEKWITIIEYGLDAYIVSNKITKTSDKYEKALKRSRSYCNHVKRVLRSEIGYAQTTLPTILAIHRSKDAHGQIGYAKRLIENANKNKST